MIAGLADFWRRRKLMIIVGVAFLCLVAVFVHVRVQPLRRRSSDKTRFSPSTPAQGVQQNKANGKKKGKNKVFAPPPFIQKIKNRPLGPGWPNPKKPGGFGNPPKAPVWGKPPEQKKPPVQNKPQEPDKKLPVQPNKMKDELAKPLGKPQEPSKKDRLEGKKMVENIDQWNMPKDADEMDMDMGKPWKDKDFDKKKMSIDSISTTSLPLTPSIRDKFKDIGMGRRKGFGKKKMDTLGEADEDEKKEGKELPGSKKDEEDKLDDEDNWRQGKGRDKDALRKQDGRGIIPGGRRDQDGRLGRNRQQQGGDRWRQGGQQNQPGGQQNQGWQGQQGRGQLDQRFGGQQGQGDQQRQWSQKVRGQQDRRFGGQQDRRLGGQQGQVGQQGQWNQQVLNQPGQLGQQGYQPGQSWRQQQGRNQQGQGGQWGQPPEGQQGQRLQQGQWAQQNRLAGNPQGPNRGVNNDGQGGNPLLPRRQPGMNRLQGGGGLARHLTSVNKMVNPQDAYVRTTTPIGTPPSLKHTKRQEAVVDAFRHAWKAYSKYAWGKDEYNPLTHKGVNTLFGQGLTIIDSLDTLWMMGLHEEYQRARGWVADNLDIEHNSKVVSVFETTIRVLGGLLSIYHLTGDRLYLEKATKFGTRLLPAFQTASDIPSASVSLETGLHNVGSSSTITVAEAGTLQLEFRDLSRATGNMTFRTACDNAMDQILSASGGGMVSMTLEVRSGQFRGGVYTAGAGVDSYYEYLLKQWLQSGKVESKFRDAYVKSTREVLSTLVGTTKPHNMAYLGIKASRRGGRVTTFMDHLSCFYPGMLALGAMNDVLPETRSMAENLTHTCYYMYNITTPTHLAPETFRFSNKPTGREDVLQSGDPQNLQRPETVESLFYLYRLTRDEKYREWAWKIFEAFRNSTKLEEGYSSLSSVYVSRQYKDRMESFFLAETLKYLFLIFGEDTTFLSLDEWVFNTEAHPLPIWKVT